MSDRAETAESAFWDGATDAEARERYRTLVQAIDDGIYLLDADARVVAVNDAVTEITGYGRTELLGEHVSVLFDDDAVVAIGGEIERTRANPGERSDLLDLAVRTAGGGPTRCEIRVSPVGDGAVCTVREVDRQETSGQRAVTDENREPRGSNGANPRERERKLERYERIVENLPVGVYRNTPGEDGEFVAANSKLAAIFDADSVEELLEYNVSDLYPDSERRAEFSRELRRAGIVEGFELEQETFDGETIWISVTAMKTEEVGEVYFDGVVQDVTERRERERQLERYETILETVNDGIYVVDEDDRFTMVNDAYAEMLGYDRAELLGEDVSVVVDDDVAEQAKRTEAALLDDETDRPVIEAELTTATGDRITAEATFAMLPAADDLGHRVGVVRDVTEREQTKRQLADERDMFAQGPAVVFRWENEPGWPVEYVSENVEDVLGYAPRELESGDVPYTDLLVDEELDRIAREVAENSDERTERFSHDPYRVRTGDGDVRWVKDTTKILRDEAGEITGYLGYLVDVTERIEQRRRIEESERRYRTLAENFPNGAVGVYDDDLRFTLVEGAVLGETLPSGERLQGKTLSEMFPAEVVATLEPLYRAAIEDGEIGKRTTEFGGRNWRIWAAPLRGADDEISAGLSFAQDITEQVERERRLEELIDRLEASNERLEQFAYAASHDLQEPLRMVSSYLQLLEGRYRDELDADGREFIDFAVDGADRMRHMIEGLLQYSRVETDGNAFEPVDLEAVFADVRADLQVRIEESDAEITVSDLPTVRGDGDQLRQVLQNLLDNAIEYSGDEPPRVHVDAERHGEEWLLSVRDDGIGLDPEYADRVFEVFESLHSADSHTGTGIGLALCERIVERHGGHVWVESEPGGGSTFFFTLPGADNFEQ